MPVYLEHFYEGIHQGTLRTDMYNSETFPRFLARIARFSGRWLLEFSLSGGAFFYILADLADELGSPVHAFGADEGLEWLGPVNGLLFGLVFEETGGTYELIYQTNPDSSFSTQTLGSDGGGAFPDGTAVKYVGTLYLRADADDPRNLLVATSPGGSWSTVTITTDSVFATNADLVQFTVIGTTACAIIQNWSTDEFRVYTASVSNLSAWTRRGTGVSFNRYLGRLGDVLFMEDATPNQMQKSIDGGVTWTAVAMGSSYVEEIQPFYNADGTTSMADGIGYSRGATSVDSYLTLNSGASWSAINFSGYDSVNSIIRTSDGTLYAAVSNTLDQHVFIRSTNNGSTWTDITPSGAVNGFGASLYGTTVVFSAYDAAYEVKSWWKVSGATSTPIVLSPTTRQFNNILYSDADGYFIITWVDGASSGMMISPDLSSFSNLTLSGKEPLGFLQPVIVPDTTSDFGFGGGEVGG